MHDDVLHGCRVLDLSQYLPGPFATRQLADLGADVVKVEPPAGDPMRNFIFLDDDGLSPLYKQVNAGKAVLHLDLKSADGVAALEELVQAADVMLESYRPGVMERLGFGRTRLQSLNPSLVHCTLSGFGQNGPASQRAGHDLTYMALSGMLHNIGTAEVPVIPFPPISDYATGEKATTMILAALLQRERQGQGCHIDVSLFETVLAWQSFSFAGAERDDDAFERGQGLLSGGAACYQIYRTADAKFVALAAIEEKFWQAFCNTVGRPELKTRQQELMPQINLIGELRELFSTASRDHWVELLAETDCCFEPLLEPEEVLLHPQVVYRQMVAPRQESGMPTDILLPSHVDGRAPSCRQPLTETCTEEVAARWQKLSLD